MLSIEHCFDATVITLVDEGFEPLLKDVVADGFEEFLNVKQYDPRGDQPHKIYLLITQMRDLTAAISLPEGVYSRSSKQTSKA